MNNKPVSTFWHHDKLMGVYRIGKNLYDTKVLKIGKKSQEKISKRNVKFSVFTFESIWK